MTARCGGDDVNHRPVGNPRGRFDEHSDACGGVIFSPSSWEPQEEGMMSIATRFFPQLRNQGLSFRRGADK
jgi:hypothetical protein